MFNFRSRARARSWRNALASFFREPFRTTDPEEKGQRLLRAWLTPEQRTQFDSYGYFEVIGGETGVRYRIHHGIAANIEELDQQGVPIIGRCFLPIGYLVAGDVMLAQKIALETNERSALVVAQKFSLSDPLPRATERRPWWER